MTLAGRNLAIAFPDTVLEEHDSLREKTVKLGQLARAASVFGVDVVQVFRDPRGGGEAALIGRVLRYLETPQYLRRRLFPLDDSLRYAGLLPPLRIPSHKPRVPVEALRAGEFREGVVLDEGRLTVDIGLERPLVLDRRAAGPGRVTVRVTSTSPLRGVQTDRSQTGEYWGYLVEERSADQVLSDPRFELRVATSRLGDPLAATTGELARRLGTAKGVEVLFGSPSRGLFETLGKDLRRRVAFVVNLYPEQHVVTVRTEEAVPTALYLLQVLSVSPDTKV
ncbi:MAG: RNA methyltransferase [Nitrososphaerales archaeon]